ncbi:hypothetical protein B0H63DRAFT_507527 [Podospora didyma]|uniref:Ecp2 effector protein domain-containing protein n=1 Tax=Podospora didyma TaxID=330526 RepID=A0AAE0U4B1_9PEZI|nr:hypothetical protein B0H63DRAFT_507527 [Podospora didyma]
MKTTAAIVALTSFLFSTASAAPADQTENLIVDDVESSVRVTLDAFNSLDANNTIPEPAFSAKAAACTWDDGFGTIDCGYWSIVFGDGNIAGHTNVLTIKGSNFEQGFNSPLPYVISIHPGNACRTGVFPIGEYYDNAWINYANQHLDLPSDSRCGPVHQQKKGRRCIIAQRP